MGLESIFIFHFSFFPSKAEKDVKARPGWPRPGWLCCRRFARLLHANRPMSGMWSSISTLFKQEHKGLAGSPAESSANTSGVARSAPGLNLPISELNQAMATLALKSFGYIEQKIRSKTETELLLQGRRKCAKLLARPLAYANLSSSPHLYADFIEILKSIFDHSRVTKPEIEKFLQQFKGSSVDTAAALDEVYRVAHQIESKLMPACEVRLRESKLNDQLTRTLEHAEAQLRKAELTARRRDKAERESQEFLRKTARRMQELEKKEKAKIDIEHQAELLKSIEL